MPRRIASLLVLCLVLAVMPALGQVLYEDGPVNGTTDAWTINFGYIVSNTFTLTSSATVTGFDIYTWLFPGDVLLTVDYFMTSQEFGGTTYASGTAKITDSFISLNQYGYEIHEDTASGLNINLGAGTYWLNLANASVASGDPVYWDENSGIGCHSPGCPSEVSENSEGTIPPESFDVTGSYGGGTTPEPSDIWLFGSGLLGLAAVLRRKLWQ